MPRRALYSERSNSSSRTSRRASRASKSAGMNSAYAPVSLASPEGLRYLYRSRHVGTGAATSAEGEHEIRHLLRAPAAAPLDGAQRIRALAELASPDRARRSARLRLRLGSRAPLPRGVLALVGP